MNIYREITDRIIDQMEQGIIPWRKPWQSRKAISYGTGNAYSLLNQMLLGEPGEYLTFNECRKAGGYVRKGEKAHMVVFWKWLEEIDKDTGEVKEIPFLRYYNVFHIDQCEGVKAKHEASVSYPNTAQAYEAAEVVIQDYVTRSGVCLTHSEGDRAYYQPASDRVVLPLMKQFAETSEYYSAAFHELVHSTGHSSRLNRLEKTAFFGSEAYSKEELVAEIGASALVNEVGLETEKSFTNNTAYIQNWLQVLKNDKRFIVSAAGKADKAVELILGKQKGGDRNE